jgi:hypothetical protein
MSIGLFRSDRGIDEFGADEDFESEDFITRLKTHRVTTIKFKAAL